MQPIFYLYLLLLFKLFLHSFTFTDATLEDFESVLGDWQSKEGFVSTFANLAYFNKHNFQKGTLNVIPRYQQSMIPFVILYPVQSPLIDPLNAKILRMQSSGLINHWATEYVNNKFVRRIAYSRSIEPLEFGNVAAAFNVLLFGYFVSGLAFLVEQFWYERKGKPNHRQTAAGRKRRR
jgi:hypothetical protein